MNHVCCAPFLVPRFDGVKTQCPKGGEKYHRSMRDLRRKTFGIRSRNQAIGDSIRAEIVQHLRVRKLERFQDQFVHVHLSFVPFVDIIMILIDFPIVVVKAPSRLRKQSPASIRVKRVGDMKQAAGESSNGFPEPSSQPS